MSSDLWSFTLKTYALSGVEAACLQLQGAGANVCLLLCAAWLGERGVACTAQRLELLREQAEPWHRDVVQPLRQLRNQWRPASGQDPELRILREQVKALELEAERQLLMRLQDVAEDWPEGQADDFSAWLEGVAAEAANFNRDTLQVLRVAVTSA